MKKLFKSRFGTAYALFFVFITVSTLTRTVLFLQSFRDIDSSLGLILKIYGTGFFFDAVTFSYAVAPLIVYLAIIPNMFSRHRLHTYLLYSISIMALFGMFFISFAEYFFWDEFGTRFNFIAVDYLIYTREVVGNIWESYPMPALLSALILITIGGFVLIKRCIAVSALDSGTGRQRLAGAFMLLSLPILSYCFVDLSHSSISENKFANNLATNGIYTFCEAFMNNSLDYYEFYKTEPDNDVFNNLRQLTAEKNTTFTVSDPIARTIKRVVKKYPGDEADYNVILIMMESMSAKYFEAFGNKEHLTSNFDKIARQGMLFKNLYATGNRTVRGMEAVMLSVPPTPGRSIVKRPHNENLNSIGSIFAERGYDNKFIYGGYGYFDNMNYFFGNNGFTIVDRKDFTDSEVTSENTWGICDQNLLDRVLKESDASYADSKKFFSFVMTMSNHRPFTFPDSKIKIPARAVHRNRKRGVAYTDQAIGEFIEKARTRPWFKNTLFVIIADHCSSSSGKTDLPLKNYRIPLIIYAPALIAPTEIKTLASQIDTGPTIFDLLNWQYESSFVGQSILKMSPAQERAFIANYLNLGYLTDNTLTILKPGNIVSSFTVDRETNTIKQEQHDLDKHQRNAIAYYQGTSFLYQQTITRNLSPLRIAHSNTQEALLIHRDIL